MTKFYLEIPFKLEVLQANRHQGPSHLKQNKELNTASWLSKCHSLQHWSKKHWLMTDFLILQSFLRVHIGYFASIKHFWNGNQVLWFMTNAKKRVIKKKNLFWTDFFSPKPFGGAKVWLHVFPFMQSRTNIIILLCATLILDHSIRNTFKTGFMCCWQVLL